MIEKVLTMLAVDANKIAMLMRSKLMLSNGNAKSLTSEFGKNWTHSFMTFLLTTVG